MALHRTQHHPHWEERKLTERERDPGDRRVILQPRAAVGARGNDRGGRRPDSRRGNAAGAGLHIFDEVPKRLFTVPRQDRRLDATETQRREAGLAHGCEPWQIGPCAGCGSPIRRYGNAGVHACQPCRTRTTRR
ncbi:hypothetical protein [Kitasatospora sp. NPDC094016]|uniref:hypothetical protein n=1 Tax=Kitasatospora sp. NPDC094016 TaxID=3154986 RepID=UPI00331DB6D8